MRGALLIALISVLVAVAPGQAAADDPLGLPASPKAWPYSPAAKYAPPWLKCCNAYEAGAQLEDRTIQRQSMASAAVPIGTWETR